MAVTDAGQGDWRRRDDARVYLTLQRARWRCDRLASASDRPRHLDGVRGELGLAAFVASEQLDAGQREALRRDAAPEECDQRDTPASLVEELTNLVRAAAVRAHDTQDAAVCEELHLAGLHIDAALRRLGLPLPGRRPAWSR